MAQSGIGDIQLKKRKINNDQNSILSDMQVEFEVVGSIKQVAPCDEDCSTRAN